MPTDVEKQRQRRLVVPAGLKGPSGILEQPVSNITWIPHGEIQANDYNPNAVAPPELRLLKISLLSDGWTQPIVVRIGNEPVPEGEGAPTGSSYCWAGTEGEGPRFFGDRIWFEIVDGFHRWRCVGEEKRIADMTAGALPCVVLPEKALEHRMMSTIRHNRARGDHKVQDMAKIVVFILESGMDDHELSLLLQMEPEEVSRLRDRGNMLERGSGDGFSQAWVAG